MLVGEVYTQVLCDFFFMILRLHSLRIITIYVDIGVFNFILIN